MSNFEKFLYNLQTTMPEPQPFGIYHITWLCLIVITLCFLYKHKNTYGEKQLKSVLGIYGVVVLVLEILKQLIWSFNYDPATELITWDYQWYAFPFQLCTTPMFVSLICLFLGNNKIRNKLLSYMAYITILGSIATIFMPSACFTESVLVNLHTSWLHFGSFVVSVYLLMTGEVKANFKSFKNAVVVFLGFVCVATFLNFYVYNTGVLNGETFNMFYISPYFISELPIFCEIQQVVPYFIFWSIYIFALSVGGFIIFSINCIINNPNVCKKLKSNINKIHTLHFKKL